MIITVRSINWIEPGKILQVSFKHRKRRKLTYLITTFKPVGVYKNGFFYCSSECKYFKNCSEIFLQPLVQDLCCLQIFRDFIKHYFKKRLRKFSGELAII